MTRQGDAITFILLMILGAVLSVKVLGWWALAYILIAFAIGTLVNYYNVKYHNTRW